MNKREGPQAANSGATTEETTTAASLQYSRPVAPSQAPAIANGYEPAAMWALAQLLMEVSMNGLQVDALTKPWPAIVKAVQGVERDRRQLVLESELKLRGLDPKRVRVAISLFPPDAPCPPVSSKGLSVSDSTSCPALPSSAQAPEGAGANASPWLDAYIAFSRKWSPRAYDGFHEAAGLWLLSTVAARRVTLELGGPRFTNLYIALAARSSLYAKSTTARIARDTLEAAGLDALLAADEATPQKFLFDLAGYVADSYGRLSSEDRERELLRLALPGQRGWYYDEFGQHLDAMTRKGGVMADFKGYLRRFDDCQAKFDTGTIGRGNVIVYRPYLALLANLTPADLRPLARKGAAMWRDGFWARFAFVSPSGKDRNTARFPEGRRVIPAELITPLRKWHEWLGVPAVEVLDVIDDKGKPTGDKMCRRGAWNARECQLGGGIYDRFYAYHDALTELTAESEQEDLDSNYARFAEKAIRIAMLLASLENGGQIELRHWARAQEITERWRVDLHALFAQLNEADASESEQKEEKLLEIVAKLGAPTANEAARYIRGTSASEAKDIMDGLAAAGALEIDAATHKATRRYRLSVQGGES